MGAPKQKWTKEEEAALRKGISIYGPGKWSAILKDTELSQILASRSNVDLKDKWRNINVTAHGWGSREKARMAFKKSSQIAKQSKHQQSSMALVPYSRTDILMESKPLLALEPCRSPITSSPNSGLRLEKLILEAITNLQEPKGSNKSSIAYYIEENYIMTPTLKKSLSTTLKSLVAKGKVVKIGQHYRIVANSFSYDETRKSPNVHNEEYEGKRLVNHSFDSLKRLEDEISLTTKAEIEKGINEMFNMTADEAAAYAAKAVLQAESDLAEAEEAVRDAEAAEADAEAARAFADARKASYGNARTW
eukprot:TRINITY_DN15788_c0_g1_i1.p1 TRINITY_DN15788_c0_g1~~TRINITY_DN15788_c0_g1_i1.p1  ORF type:complete len:306 (-),score=70.80 TRINITY_DN15788_c0_g1_i1:313-1230(-)